jgi:phosphoglycolate phosphatase-like HAD superfamily hydrolase
MPKLLLFDIDGTLLFPNGSGREAFRRALIEFFGTAGAIDSHNLAGGTDRGSLLELLRAEGFSDDAALERFDAFEDVMARQLESVLPDFRLEPCPGAHDLIAALRVRSSVILGLLTGNMRKTAPLKLRAAGFDPDIFIVGAYGSERAIRTDLAHLALQRANAIASLTGTDAVVIGDTPHDVACARAIGARAVAVSTGFAERDHLIESAPDFLLEDLSDLEAAMEALLGNHA